MTESDSQKRLLKSVLICLSRAQNVWPALCSQGATDAEILAALQYIWIDDGVIPSMLGRAEYRGEPEPAR